MTTNAYIPKHAPLLEYVAFIWETTGQDNASETILPQGSVEIVFNFATEVIGIMPYSQTAIRAPRCFVQGLNTHVTRVQYAGRHHLLGIRLLPHRVQDLLDVLPAELTNSSVDISLIKPEFNRIWHQLIELNSFEQRVALLQNLLPVLSASRAGRSGRLSNLFLDHGADRFRTVNELADAVCYSPRQLNRIVHRLYGLPADELTIYKKFIEAIKCMHTGHESLTTIAYQTGFYDQAHFCRVFKAYSGMTPRQYNTRKSLIPFHIFS